MIAYQEALTIIRRQAQPLPPIAMPVVQAVGCVCAEAVVSPSMVSAFTNSAMDGFAVHSAQIAAVPCTLPVVGSCVAGDAPPEGAGAGGAGASGACDGAWEIMTGAPVPSGYDAVVKIEDVTITRHNAQGRPEEIRLNAAVPSGNNVRLAGEDFRPGAPVMAAGTRIAPFHLMALTATGIDTVRVFPKPRISIFSTGKEIVDGGAVPLRPGQIRNSNGPYLMAELMRMNAVPTYAGTIHDEPDVFEACVRQALERSDVMISTGAVSAGRHDFIPDSLRRLGADILFHKVAIRPGKPVLYARFPNGVHYIGLPGNPVSTAVGARFFLRPLLDALTGQATDVLPHALLAEDVANESPLRFFLKARLFYDAQHRLCVQPLDGQESFKIHPLLAANGWLILPEKGGCLSAGQPVAVAPFDDGFLPFSVCGE